MNGRPWILAERRAVRTLYPHMRTDDVARILGRAMASIYHQAAALGVTKSPAFNASPLSGRNVKGHAQNGIGRRFQKGHVPANKGPRRPGWYRGRMRETQFKKGGFPPNRDPDFYVLGALRVNADGYIDMRVSFAPAARGWRALHLILWEDAHGPINTRTHCLRFRDGERLNVCIDNLECITRAENGRRNVMWRRLPRPLAEAIQLNGALKRRIRRLTDEEQDGRSA